MGKPVEYVQWIEPSGRLSFVPADDEEHTEVEFQQWAARRQFLASPPVLPTPRKLAHVPPPQYIESDNERYYVPSARVARRRRNFRMKFARAKGSHRREDWLTLRAYFGGRCVNCLRRPTGSYTTARGKEKVWQIDKDHIIPIIEGGSDGLDNLQPLCSICHGKKADDYSDRRPYAAIALNLAWPHPLLLRPHGTR